MASKLLEHEGVVSAVGERLVEVEFTVQDACAGCRARGMCGVDEGAEGRFVTVDEPMAEYFAVGERVMVGVEERMGIRAAVYAYMIPFVVLLGALLTTLGMGMSESAAGLTALGLMGAYYVVLWFFRARVEKDIVFKVRKI